MKANKQLDNLAIKIAEIMLRQRKEPTNLEYTSYLEIDGKPIKVYMRFMPI